MAKIMLVDDDVNLANLTKIALVKKGYTVTVFHEAIKATEGARKQNPDLILMDIMLPDQSGAETVKIFRKDPHLKDIPVIFLTALLSSAESELGLTIEGVNYKSLGKPYAIKRLLELVETTLLG